MKTKQLNGHYNIVGHNIKMYRELKGISQRELSNRLALLGVNLYNSDISRIELDELFVRDYELKAICTILCIDPNDLYKDTDHYFD